MVAEIETSPEKKAAVFLLSWSEGKINTDSKI